MKKYIIGVLFSVIFLFSAKAQVPYFSNTVGPNKLYGYTSIKFRPGQNAIESYTTFQYGIGRYFAAGVDLYTQKGSSYTGFLVRGGYKFNKWFGIGAQLTPSFDLSNNFKFSYLTSALYLNGNITENGKLFWCSNTWFTYNKDSENTWYNWEYVGFSIPMKKSQSITPMIGAIHSWKFNQDLDLAVGLYYSIRSWNIYLWGNDFFKDYPRCVIGVDFSL